MSKTSINHDIKFGFSNTNQNLNETIKNYNLFFDNINGNEPNIFVEGQLITKVGDETFAQAIKSIKNTLSRGSKLFWGNSAPNNISGVQTDDLYINTSNGNVYRYTGTSWIIAYNITGSNGDSGKVGIVGLQGITGAQGLVGSIGAIGAQGITGAQGIAGAQGTTGTRGITGAQGPSLNNPTGANGPGGAAGNAGVQGLTGLAGTPGAQGVTGAAGSGGSGGSSTIYRKSASTYAYLFGSSTGGSTSSGSFSPTFIMPASPPYIYNSELYAGSDIRLKKNIQPISNEFIDKLFELDNIAYEFDWKETGKHTDGFIAQYLQEIIPEAVSGEDILHVNYNGALSKIIGALFKKIKEHDEIIHQIIKQINS